MKRSKSRSELFEQLQEKDMTMVSGMLRNEEKEISIFVYTYDALTRFVQKAIFIINTVRANILIGYDEEDKNSTRPKSYNFTSFDTTKDYIQDYKFDCFIHLYQKDWEKLRKYNPSEDYFRPWLSVVTYRLFSKRKGNISTLVSKEGINVDNVADGYKISPAINLRIDLNWIDFIVDNKMGTTTKIVMKKRFCEDKTNKEIAEELGISYNNVCVCISRGIDILLEMKLKEYLKG